MTDKPKQVSSSVNLKRVFWAGLMVLLLGTLYTWATWRFFTQQVPGGNDFVANASVWVPFFQDGISPYSKEAAQYTQERIYGRTTLPGEDENRLVYPFYSIVLHGPFAFLDHAVGRAIYMTWLQIALFAGVIMTLDLVRWRPRRWMLAAVLVWSLLYYPEARGIILGQFALFGFFSLACTLFLLKRERDTAAGAILVLATIKPTLIWLVLPFLLMWAVFRRRWRFLLGFGCTLATLIVGTLLILPTWISEWLNRILMYTAYTVGQSPVWLLCHDLVPQLGTTGELAVAGLLFLGMLIAWRLAFLKSEWFYWSLGITLVVSNLIVPRSATTNYVLMLIPTLWGFAMLDRRLKSGSLAILALMAISLIGLWWLHFASVVGNQEQAIMFIPMPIILGLGLLIGRTWFLQDAKQSSIYL